MLRNIHNFFRLLILALFIAAPFMTHAQSLPADPLPSWNDGATKQAILAFVGSATTEGGANYVPVEQRIAVFDNDGTLWAEQPIYFQIAFALDRIKVLAVQHPEWKNQQPYKAILEGDGKAAAANGPEGLLQVLATAHTGMTTEQFNTVVKDWIATAKHPGGRLYREMVYQPQLELIRYLRAKGFKVFIVSGGGVEFMRGFAETLYGIPPEQVIGSSAATAYHVGPDGVPFLMKTDKVEVLNDGPGKVENINRFIGRRPVLAFGNSDGDKEMLEWTDAAKGAHLAVLLHHTDAVREWAYDRASPVGRLDTALDEAAAKHWLVVDMKSDWKTVFPAKQ
ncbi:MAG: HAD family hydrolase [Alphaproteobacteria bacterium]